MTRIYVGISSAYIVGHSTISKTQDETFQFSQPLHFSIPKSTLNEIIIMLEVRR